MIFRMQAYLEDYFNKRRFVDSDGYAANLANFYSHNRFIIDEASFLNKVHKINTTFFANNSIENRREFEANLIEKLDKKFKKKQSEVLFPGGVIKEKENFSYLPRLTINHLLDVFCFAVEARAIDQFWVSRKKGILRDHAEKIGQGLFATFVEGSLIDRKGFSIKEFQSGIGFVDFVVVLSNIPHLVEMKVLKDSFSGVNQLEQYMKTERRSKGSLLVFDSGLSQGKIELPPKIVTATGEIKIYRANINPIPPSRLN